MKSEMQILRFLLPSDTITDDFYQPKTVCTDPGIATATSPLPTTTGFEQYTCMTLSATPSSAGVGDTTVAVTATFDSSTLTLGSYVITVEGKMNFKICKH